MRGDLCYVEDLSVHGNCYEGTEAECRAEIENLVINYGHERSRYALRTTRFD